MDHVAAIGQDFHESMGSEVSLSQMASWLSSGILVFGGIVPYIPQYLDIKRTESTEGFSLYVCLALLLANTLRILFWFGHTFELPLLIQSIWMNIAMLAIIHLCIHVRQRSEIIPAQQRTFTDKDTEDSSLIPSGHGPPTPRVFMDFDPKYFWEWTDFLSYVEFIMSFTCAVGALVYVFLAVPAVIETIGFLAVLIEAMLGAPQFYRNYVNKSTVGMSVKMVLLWTLGDIYKTTYFVIKETPLQFVVCGSLQLVIDITILSQVVFYGFRQPSSVLRPKPYKFSS